MPVHIIWMTHLDTQYPVLGQDLQKVVVIIDVAIKKWMALPLIKENLLSAPVRLTTANQTTTEWTRKSTPLMKAFHSTNRSTSKRCQNILCKLGSTQQSLVQWSASINHGRWWAAIPRVALAFGEIRRRREQLLVGAISVQHQPRHLQAPADVDLQVAMHEPHPCTHVHHQRLLRLLIWRIHTVAGLHWPCLVFQES